MKKTLLIVMVLVLLLLTVACEKDKENNATTTTTGTGQTHEILPTSMIYQSDNSKEDETKNDNGGGYIESSKYRQCYYHVPVYFIELVGEEEYHNWHNEIYEFNQDKIKIGSFVRYFNISKEVFEKTNLQMAKDFVEWGEKPTLRPLDYENQQTYEIYNADIIYTFDDEIINEYYLTPDYPYCADFEYEAAVKRDEYTSQTEDWVDVEALEAEIIAKYGEAEIVTEETATALPEEILAIPTEPIETTS